MTELVAYSTQSDIALIRLGHPPVNSLGLDVRRGLLSSFERALADSSVKVIVLHSAIPGVFCGGADITEFSSDKAFAEPYLASLLSQMEESPKPIVAAIDGVTLGGGCELSLICDYRVGSLNAQIGLPEVNLGILPGAGGTQRMPRIVGAQAALDMIVSGMPITAQQALAAGYLDRLHEGKGDFLDAAIEYAKALVDSEAPTKSCATVTVDTGGLSEQFFDDYRQAIAAKTQGYFAPERCIQAVEAACSLPLTDGLKREQELVLECMASPQARALQHVFFAKRAASKVPGVDPKVSPRSINKVAIIGSGTMGGGIAMNFVNAGIDTVILDLNAEALERGIGVIRKNYERTVKKGRLSQDKYEQRMSKLSSTTTYDDIRDVDLVIEAVFEDMNIKKTVFKTLDEVCKPGAILATNTSTLDVDEIAAVTGRPSDVIGLHFFSPANVMPLLEVVRAKSTADDVIISAMKVAKKIRKVAVVVGVCFGFVGNRMVEPYGREGARLLLEGASPEQIDRVLTEYGMAMGYCATSDLAGIDIGYLVRQGNQAAIAHDTSYCVVMDRLYDSGAYGQKVGKGVYVYGADGVSVNPDVKTIAESAAAELGVERRQISDQEVLERLLFPLINEGLQILEEGIASRSSDIDLIYLYGYGFPRWRGGPMQYAEEIGLDALLAGMKQYRQQLGDYGDMWFTPAPLLERLVSEGKGFKDL